MNHLTHSAEERKQRFLSQSIALHGTKYDYSKVVYTTAREKIEIICPTHGSFFQLPDSHRRGIGCSKCGFEKSKPKEFSKRKSQEQFIAECKAKHNSYYDYSKVEYTGKDNNIVVTCPKHGDFSQKAGAHLTNGVGCKQCGTERAHAQFLHSTQDSIKKVVDVHSSKYGYSHLQAVFEFVKSLDPNLEVINGSRKIIPPLELDVVIPSKKIAIEFNGLYWHSEQAGKGRNYHLDKTLQCQEAGYQLLHIFEDEWLNNEAIVKARLRHILGYDNEQKYFARKLTVKQVSSPEAKEFFRATHIQGACTFSSAYGLYNEDQLVACISFGANRFTKEREIELIRYSTRGNVVGGFSRLLKAYLKDHPEVEGITSYSDKRWSVGNVYSKNGFEYAGSSQPGYFYVEPTSLTRINRVQCQKHKLPELLGEAFDPNLTEVQNMVAAGYVRIFDAGMDKWSFTR